MITTQLSNWASISRLHIVAIAAMGTFTFGWLFLGSYPWLLSAICALDWFLVNILNRVVDLTEDQANQIKGTDVVARHRRLILWGGFSLLAVSFVFCAFWVTAILPFRVAYHLLGFAYNWNIAGQRIKERYFWKNTASATGFVLTLFCYPLATIGFDVSRLPEQISLPTIVLSALFFFLFEISYEILYDLRDIEGDRLAQVKTYPVVHGEKVATQIIDFLLISSALLLWFGFALGVIPWRICIMFAAPVLQLVLYKKMLARGKITSADCIGLTWLGAALLACYHLWVYVGLPGVGV